MDNNELMHHGILGQKWGVRRYQNRDGTLTSAGKRRRRESDDYKSVASLRKKKPYEMSNAELRKLNERQQLERNYSQLNPNAVQKGWKFVAATAGVMGTVVALHSNSEKLVSIGKSFVGKL